MHIDSVGVATFLTQRLEPSSRSQQVPFGQSLGDEHVSGGWPPPPVVPLDAPVVVEPLLIEPVLALPLVPAPLPAPLLEAPLAEEPLLEAPLAEEPLFEAPLVDEPLVVAPVVVLLPVVPALDDPLAEVPVDDPALEPLAAMEPDELPTVSAAPPHATNAVATIDTTMERRKNRTMRDPVIASNTATDVPAACP